MQIRPAILPDLDAVHEIDGTIEATHYLHLDQSGENLSRSWRLEQRPAREKLIEPNRLPDDSHFLARQILAGGEEGLVLIAEHDQSIVAALIAHHRPHRGTLHINDLRVDYDFRRQGLGLAMVYQTIQNARDSSLRAVSAHTPTNNIPASALLAKCGFDLCGVDTRRLSNHDVVKESATLFWYAALD